MVIVPGAEASPGSDTSTAEPLVLVVDPQPLFGAAISQLLNGPELRARTLLAVDSDSALECLRTEPVDLVVCDIRVQPMPYRELIDQLVLCSKPPPIMLLGEQQDEELLVDALHGRAAGLFTKNAPPDQFLSGVRAVLSGHRALGQELLNFVLTRLSGQAPSCTPPGLTQLSRTEVHILTMVGAGNSVQSIAASRGISEKTVRNHLANIYRKLSLRSRTEAVLCATRMGLAPR